MYIIEETGGAKVGMIRMTWPFAKLSVDKNTLKLDCSIAGTFIFRPGDVISIVPGGYAFKTGIQIKHNVSDYYSTIIFTTTENAAGLIGRIEQTGFLNNTEEDNSYNTVGEIQKQGPFPLKISAAIIIVLIWNVLFLSDEFGVFKKNENIKPLGYGAQTAVGFMFLVALSILVFQPARQLIMKKDRSVEPLKYFLYFLMFITGFMFIALSVISNLIKQ